MTTLTVRRDAAGIRSLAVSGHSGFAPHGEDIVCAAVSVLMTTGVNALESVAEVLPVFSQDETVPAMELTLPMGLGGQAAHDAQVILRTVLRGMADIAEAYPKHLLIIDGRNQSC